MRLFLIRFEDRFHDLVSVLNLTTTVLFINFILFTTTTNQSVNSIADLNTKSEVYDDHSFGGNLNSCSDVNIRIIESKPNGVIHSPNYFKINTDSTSSGGIGRSNSNTNNKRLNLNENVDNFIFDNQDDTLDSAVNEQEDQEEDETNNNNNNADMLKCKWTLNAPVDHQLDLIFVDYERQQLNGQEKPSAKISQFESCLNNRLRIRTLSDESIAAVDSSTFDINSNLNSNKPTYSYNVDTKLWMSLYDDTNNQSVDLLFANNLFDSCNTNKIQLKPFTRLETNSSKLVIEYESIKKFNYLNFFIKFNAINKKKAKLNEPLVSMAAESTPTPTSTSTSKESNTNYVDECAAQNESTTNDFIKCFTRYNLSQENLSQYNCLSKNLICNCNSYINSLINTDNNNKKRQQESKRNNCDYLLEIYGADYSKTTNNKNDCNYLLELNKKCRDDDKMRLFKNNQNDVASSSSSASPSSSSSSSSPSLSLSLIKLNEFKENDISRIEDNIDLDEAQPQNSIFFQSDVLNEPDLIDKSAGGGGLIVDRSSSSSLLTPFTTDNIPILSSHYEKKSLVHNNGAASAPSGGSGGGGINSAAYYYLSSDSCFNQSRTNEFGWISSPNYLNSKNYPSDLNCFYHIILQPNQIVQIRFKHFYLDTNKVDVTQGGRLMAASSLSSNNDVDIDASTSSPSSSSSSSNQQQQQTTTTKRNSNSKRKLNKRNNHQQINVAASGLDLDEQNIIIASSSVNISSILRQNVKLSTNVDASFRKQPPSYLGRTIDYDYLNIYDGPTIDSPLIAHLTSSHNDFNRIFNGRVFNSHSNHMLIVFHTQSSKWQSAKNLKRMRQSQQQQQSTPPPLMGFNLTYQIKGLCIEDQLSCDSPYELNCYSPNQTCNDVWDCHNGADERGCSPCKSDQFRCRNHIFCYRLEDRCDGDHQCIDKSDELNCDPWFCNSANGTFLCSDGRCVYEQWVCDGANDCDDGSDERNCPTPFTRRVITTAVLGGTLCCLLLVMALGCACKLYTLHTVGYRNSIRLSQTVQSAAAAAAAAPLLSSISTVAPTMSSLPTNSSLNTNNSNPAQIDTSSNGVQSNVNSCNNANNVASCPTVQQTTGSSIYNSLASLFRRPFQNLTSSSSENANSTLNSNTNSSFQFNFAGFGLNINANQSAPLAGTTTAGAGATSATNSNNPTIPPGELPMPHHLIAPPTYNQTMGLVDEYEQRQLAFIEHVRSILAQQQHQQQNGSTTNNNSNIVGLTNGTNTNGQFSAMSLIPTVTTSSTTVHRVTSGRRSHSSRHHRHHNHRSTSNTGDSSTNGAVSSTTNSAAEITSATRSHRTHRHRHHHHNHTQSHSSHTRHLNQNSTNGHQLNANSSQNNFDANRRGLIIQQQQQQEQQQQQLDTSSISTSSSQTDQQQQQQYHQHQHQHQQPQSQRRRSGLPSLITSLRTNGQQQQQQTQQQQQQQQTGSNYLPLLPTNSVQSPLINSQQQQQQQNQIESTSNTTNSTFNTIISKTQTNTINLRDKIAKLIKDIVVHHGDNIQYVQLADQATNGSTNVSSNTSERSTNLINDRSNQQITSTADSTSTTSTSSSSSSSASLLYAAASNHFTNLNPSSSTQASASASSSSSTAQTATTSNFIHKNLNINQTTNDRNSDLSQDNIMLVSSHNNNQSNNGSEDDVPLIQP